MRVHRIALICLFSGLYIATASQQPTPTPGKVGDKQQKQTKSKAQIGNNLNAVSPPSSPPAPEPLSGPRQQVKGEPTPYNYNGAPTNKSNHEKVLDSNIMLVTITFWLFITGILQFITIDKQRKLMQMQVELMGKSSYIAQQSADAARRSADVAEASLRNLERPYLFVEIANNPPLHCLLQSGPGATMKPTTIQYTVANYGRSPALVIERHISFAYAHSLQEAQRLSRLAAHPILNGIVEHGGHDVAQSVRLAGWNSGRSRRNIGLGDIRNLHFQGVIVYRSIIDNAEHKTGFAYQGLLREGQVLFEREGGEEYNYYT